MYTLAPKVSMIYITQALGLGLMEPAGDLALARLLKSLKHGSAERTPHEHNVSAQLLLEGPGYL